MARSDGKKSAQKKATPRRALPYDAVTLPVTTQHVLADFRSNLVQRVHRAAEGEERELAVARENIAHAAFRLLSEFGDRPTETDDARKKRLTRASRAASAAMKALGVSPAFASSDGRGNIEAKRRLLDVTQQAIALYLPSRAKVKRKADAYFVDGGPPRTIDLPAAEAAKQIALFIEAFGLAYAGCIALLGMPSESACAKMEHAIMDFLGKSRAKQHLAADELCSYALWKADLVTAKARAGFFDIKGT